MFALLRLLVLLPVLFVTRVVCNYLALFGLVVPHLRIALLVVCIGLLVVCTSAPADHIDRLVGSKNLYSVLPDHVLTWHYRYTNAMLWDQPYDHPLLSDHTTLG